MILVLIVAYALLVIGGIMMLIAALSESLLWGLACLFLPIVSLFFLVVHWQEAKKGFFLQLVGLVLLLVGTTLAPGAHHSLR